MSLDGTRAALNALLDRSDVCTRLESSWDAAKADIEAWWSDYKLFEQEESFQRAFDDQRMTVRWSKRGLDAKIDLQAVPQGRANPQKFPKQAAPLEGVAARFAQHQPAEVFGLDLGIRGVVRRTGPANFCAGSGNSRKAELGLHDLSASLLRKKDIASQLFNELNLDSAVDCSHPLATPHGTSAFSPRRSSPRRWQRCAPDRAALGRAGGVANPRDGTRHRSRFAPCPRAR